VTTLFSSSEPKIYELYLRFEDLVKQMGEATVFPQRTHIDFIAARPPDGCTFASVEARGDFMAVAFHFERSEDNVRFAKIEQTGPDDWLHWVRVDDVREYDDEFRRWLERAYRGALEGSGG
jgi:hypothetical protein